MNLQCPLCGYQPAEADDYRRHLADEHGLVDDEGAQESRHGLEAPAPPSFAPLEPMSGPPLLPPPPPVQSAPLLLPLLPPPPPLLAPPPSAAPVSRERSIPKGVVVAMVAAILALTVAAMVFVGRSGSSPTRAETSPGAGHSDVFGAGAPDPSTTTTSVPTVVASTTSTTDSVDPHEAHIAAGALWSGLSRAESGRDIDALRAYEDGPLLASDIGEICQVGCPPPEFSAEETITVNVPHQTGWPATFFASVSYTGCVATQTPCIDEFVARQDEKGGPWKAILLIHYGGHTTSEQPQLLPDGYAVPGPDAGSTVPPLLADYANYLTALKTTGAKPASTALADGPFTSDTASALFDPPEAQRDRGLSIVTEYHVDPTDPVATFVDGLGATTACGVVRSSSVVQSASGDSLPAGVSVQEFRMRMADGRYSSITAARVHMVCFSQLAGDPVVVVIAGSGQIVAVTGVPA